MSYYQKYRSDKVADLDLVAIRNVFGTIMKTGQVAHAYLFVGPRGLGKTSAARILARLVNCEKNGPTSHKATKGDEYVEPCGECSACVSIKNNSAVDVMEIDAASHGGVDDVRDLREKVGLTAAVLAKKIYIIDEVHMLSTGAFNALLKTLEEPPENVIFVLCTTEAHKVPETIMSRCVRINFAKATLPELISSLRRVVSGEKLDIGDEALATLAGALDGSFREGHKLLEQIANQCAGKQITSDDVRKVLGLMKNGSVEAILKCVEDGEVSGVVEIIGQLESSGADAIDLASKLLEHLRRSIREEIIAGNGLDQFMVKVINKLIRATARIRVSPLPMLPLELVLEKAALERHKAKGIRQKEVVEKPRVEEEKKMTATIGVEFEKVVSGWHDLLTRLAPRNHSVAGLLRSAKPKEMNDKFLTIEVFYKFHKEQLEQQAKRQILEEEIAKMWGPMSVRCVLGQKTAPQSGVFEYSKDVRLKVEGDAVSVAEEVFGV